MVCNNTYISYLDLCASPSPHRPSPPSAPPPPVSSPSTASSHIYSIYLPAFYHLAFILLFKLFELLNYLYFCTYYLTFCVRFISLSIWVSGCIHVPTNDSSLSFLTAEHIYPGMESEAPMGQINSKSERTSLGMREPPSH